MSSTCRAALSQDPLVNESLQIALECPLVDIWEGPHEVVKPQFPPLKEHEQCLRLPVAEPVPAHHKVAPDCLAALFRPLSPCYMLPS